MNFDALGGKRKIVHQSASLYLFLYSYFPNPAKKGAEKNISQILY